MKLFIVTLVGMLILINAAFAIKEKSKVKDSYVLSSELFAKKIKSSKILLVDVRSSEEYAEGHLANAVQIDIHSDNFVDLAVSAKEKNKKKVIALYCRSGKRSHAAAGLLISKGIKVIELDGGILQWIKHGQPIVK